MQDVAYGSRLVNETASALELIAQQAAEVERNVHGIARSQQAQSLAMSEIESSARKLAGATEQNAAFVEELASSCESMRDEAQGLSEKVGYFRLV